MPHATLLLVYPTAHAQLCYWLTEDVTREDMGCSCAGFQCVSEIAEELRSESDNPSSHIQVADFSKMSVAQVDALMSDLGQLQTRVEQVCEPLDGWLNRQLPA